MSDWVDNLDGIERRVWVDSDAMLDARGAIYEHLRKFAYENLNLQQLDPDWAEENWEMAQWSGDVVMRSQMLICMVYRLMGHFPSPEITAKDAVEWRRRTLLFFDDAYSNREDELDAAEMDDYQQAILDNYARLIPLLWEGEDVDHRPAED